MADADFICTLVTTKRLDEGFVVLLALAAAVRISLISCWLSVLLND